MKANSFPVLFHLCYDYNNKIVAVANKPAKKITGAANKMPSHCFEVMGVSPMNFKLIKSVNRASFVTDVCLVPARETFFVCKAISYLLLILL